MLPGLNDVLTNSSPEIPFFDQTKNHSLANLIYIIYIHGNCVNSSWVESVFNTFMKLYLQKKKVAWIGGSEEKNMIILFDGSEIRRVTTWHID